MGHNCLPMNLPLTHTHLKGQRTVWCVHRHLSGEICGCTCVCVVSKLCQPEQLRGLHIYMTNCKHYHQTVYEQTQAGKIYKPLSVGTDSFLLCPITSAHLTSDLRMVKSVQGNQLYQ